MGIELVVLDFDGTLTDVWKEALPAIAGWKADVASELGFTSAQIESRWNQIQERIEQDPSHYGWRMGDKIVAPAYADPNVMARTISDILFDEEQKYMDRSERENILQHRIFATNYKKMGTVFKPEADDFLFSLQDEFRVCVVTNSGTESVMEKISQLPTSHSKIPVYGDAKKYVLNSEWRDVPESVYKEGFGRPLYLQREKYWNLLTQVMAEHSLAPEQVAVVGDIYELDLLLPEQKNMRIILAASQRTPTYELDAVRAYSRGHTASDLFAIHAYLNLNKNR